MGVKHQFDIETFGFHGRPPLIIWVSLLREHSVVPAVRLHLPLLELLTELLSYTFDIGLHAIASATHRAYTITHTLRHEELVATQTCPLLLHQ